MAETITEDTRTQAEQDSIASDARAKEAEADAHQAKVDDLKEKLARLDQAYTDVKAVKQSVKDEKTFYFEKCISYYNDGNCKWVGSTYDKAETDINGTAITDAKTYIDELDDILDAIGNLRTQYENDILEETTILSGLLQAINSLWDKWKNYWN
ncbi:MAG: DUF5082 domain-containing protein [Clostridium sp.]|nr:DUF5082 domain-containing protein [Clostridium sp.]